MRLHALPSREELMRWRARRFSRSPRRRVNSTLARDRATEREIYADREVAQILRDLGKKNPSKPRSLLVAGSAECSREFIMLFAGLE